MLKDSACPAKAVAGKHEGQANVKESICPQHRGSAWTAHIYRRNEKRPGISLLQQLVEEPAPLSINHGIQTNALGERSTAPRFRLLELPNPALNRVHHTIASNKAVPHDAYVHVIFRTADVDLYNVGRQVLWRAWQTVEIPDLELFHGASPRAIAQYSFSALLCSE
jgi:hypothetical protein